MTPDKITKTRYPELNLYHHLPALWRWVDTTTNSVVGPYYRTKTEALADLHRYALQFGCEPGGPHGQA